MSEYGELVVGDEKAETGGEHKDWRLLLEQVKEMRSEYNTARRRSDIVEMWAYYKGCVDAIDWVLGILESEGVNA